MTNAAGNATLVFMCWSRHDLLGVDRVAVEAVATSLAQAFFDRTLRRIRSGSGLPLAPSDVDTTCRPDGALGQQRSKPWGSTSDRLGSRPSENVREPRERRAVFSIAFFG
jgi:hypothetical protein